jgi:hypothetical protein
VKIFLSWSGQRSRDLARVLQSWLPTVLGSVHPWISDDIAKGTRWSKAIADELDQTRIAIICLTAENLHSPWLLFEAGAISRSIEKTLVCPYLIDVETSELTGPLGQFQATRHEIADVLKLVHSINNNLGESRLEEAKLESNFNKVWPLLDKSFGKTPPARHVRGPRKTLVAAVAGVIAIALAIVQSYLYIKPVNGKLEWQWAGAGWIGEITMNDGTASVRVDQFVGGGNFDKKPRFESDEPGTAKRKVGFLRTSGLKLRMPVQTYGPDGKRTEHVMLEADLDASRAFTGKVTYNSGAGIFNGGMTLLGNLW